VQQRPCSIACDWVLCKASPGAACSLQPEDLGGEASRLCSLMRVRPLCPPSCACGLAALPPSLMRVRPLCPPSIPPFPPLRTPPAQRTRTQAHWGMEGTPWEAAIAYTNLIVTAIFTAELTAKWVLCCCGSSGLRVLVRGGCVRGHVSKWAQECSCRACSAARGGLRGWLPAWLAHQGFSAQRTASLTTLWDLGQRTARWCRSPIAGLLWVEPGGACRTLVRKAGGGANELEEGRHPPAPPTFSLIPPWCAAGSLPSAPSSTCATGGTSLTQ